MTRLLVLVAGLAMLLAAPVAGADSCTDRCRDMTLACFRACPTIAHGVGQRACQYWDRDTQQCFDPECCNRCLPARDQCLAACRGQPRPPPPAVEDPAQREARERAAREVEQARKRRLLDAFKRPAAPAAVAPEVARTKKACLGGDARACQTIQSTAPRASEPMTQLKKACLGGSSVACQTHAGRPAAGATQIERPTSACSVCYNACDEKARQCELQRCLDQPGSVLQACLISCGSGKCYEACDPQCKQRQPGTITVD